MERSQLVMRIQQCVHKALWKHLKCHPDVASMIIQRAVQNALESVKSIEDNVGDEKEKSLENHRD